MNTLQKDEFLSDSDEEEKKEPEPDSKLNKLHYFSKNYQKFL